jgi:hypothetical protein
MRERMRTEQPYVFFFQPGPEWKYPALADSIESDIEDL